MAHVYHHREQVGSTLTVAHVVYALQSFAVAITVIALPTVVGSFAGIVPAVVGGMLSYVKRGDAAETWLESHYDWQIQTFWYAMLWLALGFAMDITIIAMPLGVLAVGMTALWVVYRTAVGWVTLRDGERVPA